jgi:hypothetical protein
VLARDVPSKFAGTAVEAYEEDVYQWANRLMGTLERADQDAPQIVPELEEKVARLDPLYDV